MMQPQGGGVAALLGQAPQQDQQGQQAPMPGMQPPAGGPSAGVVNLVGPLKNLPEQVLTMELLNPQSKLEKYAVLAALDQKNRERKTMQAVQNMQAMQQNAQMQGQGTVAQQVAQEAQAAEETVMAALGGLMRSYAGGGVVAFNQGGDALKKKLVTQGVPAAFIAAKEKEGLSLEDIEVEARREGYLPPMAAQSQPVMPPPVSTTRVPSASLSSLLASPEEVTQATEAPIEERQRTAERIKSKLLPDFTPGINAAKAIVEKMTGGQPDFYKQQFAEPVATEPAQTFTPQPAIDEGEMKRVREATQRGPTFSISDPANAIPQLERQLQKVGPSERAGIERQLEILRQRAEAEPSTTGVSRSVSSLVNPNLLASSRSTNVQPISITGGIPSALRESYQQRMQEETPKPASLTAAERGLDALLQARIAQEERFGREGLEDTRRAAEEAIARSKEFGARDWFEIAAAIDPRKGYAMSSLGKGFAGVMGRQEQAREAARKELTAAQREQRQIDNRVAELRILAQQEQIARERGEFDRAEKIKDRRFTLEKELAALERSYEEKAADVAIRGATAQAQLEAARRPSEIQEKINLLRTDPATFNKLVPSKEKTDLIDYLKLQSQNLVGQLEGLITPQQRAPIEAQLNQINRALAAITGVGDVAPTTSAVKPKSQSEFDALPKGARYINPSDGKEYIKN